jgi:prepilin-type N-terminal cleavage/methylation domain-containing protein
MRGGRGMTLLETLVALAVLGTGVLAVQRLTVLSVAGIATDAQLTRTMLIARALLAETALALPEPGHTAGDLSARGPAAAGLRFERDVRPTPHAGLREVRVRVFPADRPGDACELVEIVRVPTA